MQILNINKSITGEYNSTSECSYNQGAMYTTKYLIPYNVDFSSELMFSKSKFRRLTTNNVEKIMYINRKKTFCPSTPIPEDKLRDSVIYTLQTILISKISVSCALLFLALQTEISKYFLFRQVKKITHSMYRVFECQIWSIPKRTVSYQISIRFPFRDRRILKLTLCDSSVFFGSS